MFEPLYLLQFEINRIFVAGSKFATGDPRIKKQLPALEKLGEKVPVIKKIKEETEKLLESTAENASDNLFKLSILLYSVVNSITDSKFEEEKQDIIKDKSYEIMQVTMPYSVYLDVKQMLSGDKKPDYDFLEHMLTKEGLKDFRVMPYLLKSIDSKNYVLAEFVLEKVFPLLDDKAIPYLLDSFDMTSNLKSHANKLKTIYDILPDYSYDLLKKVLEEGNDTSKVVAIEKLAKLQYEDLLLPIIKDRKKALKRSAFTALSKMGSDKWIEEGLKILNSKDPSVVYDAFTCCTDQNIFDVLFQTIKRLYSNINFNSTDLSEALIEFNEVLLLLANKGHEKQIFDFIYEYLTNKDLPKNSDYRLDNSFVSIYNLVSGFDDTSFVEHLFNNYKLLKSSSVNVIIENYFKISVHNLSKEEIYDKFATLVKNNLLSKYLFLDTFKTVETIRFIYDKDDFANSYNINKIDPRFADLFIDFYTTSFGKEYYNFSTNIFLPFVMLEKDSPKIKKLIKLMLNNKKGYSKTYYLQQFVFLLNIGYDVLDIVMEILTSGKLYYYDKMYFDNPKAVQNIPKSYAKTFAELFEKQNDIFYKDIELLLLGEGNER